MMYISNIGLLGTEAFFYTDIVLLYMMLLPFFMMFSIWLAMKHRYSLHRVSQFFLLIITLGMLLLFYYEMYLSKVFDDLLVIGKADGMNAFYFFIAHLFIVIITFILWKSTLLFASADKKRRALPGLYSRTHKIAGKRVMMGTILMSITLGILYRMLYVI